MKRQYFWTPKEGDVVTKIRTHAWFNKEKQEPCYGVQVKIKGQTHRYFMHVMREDTYRVALFEDISEALNFKTKILNKYGA